MRQRSKKQEAEAGSSVEGDDEKPVASIQRATLVLDAFLDASGPLTLADLAGATGLYKSTVARILQTLELDDYVVRTRHSEYHVGPALLHLAPRYQEAIQPSDLVLPVLRELVAATGESASYVVPSDGGRISLYRVHSANAIRDHGLAGDVVPLDRGAAGHVLNAYRGDPGARAEQIRERMMALSNSEIEIGMSGMACPVFDRSRECVACVALSGPSTRFTPEHIEAWRICLLQAARSATDILGGNARLYAAVLSS